MLTAGVPFAMKLSTSQGFQKHCCRIIVRGTREDGNSNRTSNLMTTVGGGLSGGVLMAETANGDEADIAVEPQS